MRNKPIMSVVVAALAALYPLRVSAQPGDGVANEAGAANETDAANETGAANEAEVEEEYTLEDQFNELEDNLAGVEDRMDVIEKKSILDRLMLGADYRLIYNAFKYKGPSLDPYARDPMTGQPLEIDKTTPEIWSHRLRIPFKAEPNKSLRLTARLVMFKNFGDMDQAPFTMDFQATRVPRDSGVRFEQAWVDWFMADWLTLSVGRLSYTDVNPPGELKENSTVRNPTWGLQIVDGEYETINLTFDLSKQLVEDFFARAFYASWYYDNDDPMGGGAFLDSGTKNLRIIGANIDMRIPGAGQTFVQLGYYIVPKFRPFYLPISDPYFNPAADYTHAPATMNGSLLFPSKMPYSLGSYQNINGLLELLDIGGSGVDFFAGGAIGILKPNGEAIEYELLADPMDANSRMSMPFLFLASEGDDGLGAFAMTGLRYTLPIRKKFHPKLGLEFNYGSRFHISFAMPNDQLVSKLTTRGHAVEGYLIVPVSDRIWLRGGYMRIDNDYSQGFFGPNPAMFGSTAPQSEYTLHNFNFVLNTTM